MNHTAFFGDGEKTFALPSDQILELERKTGIGIGALYTRVLSGQFGFTDITEVIRLGLIGGGTSPKDANALVDAYAKPTPIIEAFQLAADILETRWSGAAVAPANSDLSAALRTEIMEAYADDPA